MDEPCPWADDEFHVDEDIDWLDDESRIPFEDRVEKWQRMMTDPRSTAELIALALTNRDALRYLNTLETLQLRGSREVLTAARTLCLGASSEERKLGAAILSRLGNNVPLLRVARQLRMSGDEEMRTRADKIYRKFGPGADAIQTFPKEALATLLPMLESETDIETLRDVICAVAEYQDFHASITARIAALRTHPHPDVRFTVSTRLALNLESEVAQQALAELANDEDERIREWVEDCLKMIALMRQ